jgi:hypothetical protein
MPCMHVLMPQGYPLCRNNFYRINTPKGTVIFIGPVGLVPLRINAVSAPLQNNWSRCISRVLRAASVKFVAVWNSIYCSLLANY